MGDPVSRFHGLYSSLLWLGQDIDPQSSFSGRVRSFQTYAPISGDLMIPEALYKTRLIAPHALALEAHTYKLAI